MDDSKVAILLEDLKNQFQVFGEGLQMVIQKTDRLEQRFDGLERKLDRHIEQNRIEHRMLMQMIQDLNHEVQGKLKRVK